MNLAITAKMGWRIIKEPESLWVKVVTGKYLQGKTKVDNFKPKQGASNLWKGITKA